MRNAPLLDCGHYLRGKGELGGHCQHAECGREACRVCLEVCQGCQKTLCPDHQKVVADGAAVYCPDCVLPEYYGRKALAFLVGGNRERSLPAGQQQADLPARQRENPRTLGQKLWDALFGTGMD
jgi:hypothetical protein